MKRAALTIVGTVAGLAVLLGFKTQPLGDGAGFAVAPLASSASDTGGGSTTTAGGSGGDGTAGGGGSGGGGSGTATSTATQSVTGSAVGTPYGPVQITVTSTGGRITDVQVLQAPWSSGTDQQINGYALPILIQETIDAQSATIDMVSGATYTSNGYIQSLQSVLDQLHA